MYLKKLASLPPPYSTEVNDHARRMIALGASCCIIFARNIETPQQVARLCADLKRAAAPRKLLIMVDQEGGRVARLRGEFTAVPSMSAVGQAGETAAAAAGTIFGRELRAVNIDINCAPVVDTNTNPDNQVRRWKLNTR